MDFALYEMEKLGQLPADAKKTAYGRLGIEVPDETEAAAEVQEPELDEPIEQASDL